jgi:hypothetical protein
MAAGKNTVINGGFDIWQRGTSFTPAANGTTFAADRWNIYRDPGSGATVSRQTSGLTNFLYACRVARDSGNTSTGSIYIWQNFESQMTYPLAGKTIVVSYYARAGANYSPTSSNIGVQLYTGTGTDQNVLSGYTGSASPVDTTQAITTTWTRYSYTVTLNSNVTEICPRFYMTPTGTAGADDYFEITGIQIEIGSVATLFTRAGGTIQGELAACQRYYWRTGPSAGAYGAIALGFASTTTNVMAFVRTPVTMRTSPTSIEYSTLQCNDSTVGTAVSAVAFSGGEYSPDGSYINFTTGSMTQFRPTKVIVSNSTTGYLALNAEL